MQKRKRNNTAGLADTTLAVPIMGKEETRLRKNRVLIIDHDFRPARTSRTTWTA